MEAIAPAAEAPAVHPQERVPGAGVTPFARPEPRLPRHARRIAALGVGLGVLADVFFDGVPLGVGWPLFLACALGGFLVAGGREAWQRARPARWLLAPMLATASFVAVRDSPELAAVNVAASALCLLLFAHFATGEERAFALGPASLAGRALSAGPRALWAAPQTVKASLVDVPLKAAGTSLVAGLRTALVVVPVVAVFAALLATADAVYAELLDDVLGFVLGGLWGTLLSRGLTVAGASLAMVGLLTFALRRSGGAAAVLAPRSPLTLRTSATVLATVSLLFLSFGAVQGRFFRPVDDRALPAGVIYSDYAHAGFFQLVAVVVLTLGLILALGRWTALPGAGQKTAFNALGTLLVACTVPLWASAVLRMTLYQAAYGATVLRVFVLAFLCAVGALLVWRAVSLWWQPQRFGGGALALSLFSAVALNLANPDALVARHNLGRDPDHQVLDVAYLTLLSADAVPAVERDTLGRHSEVRDRLLDALRARAGARGSHHPAAFNVARARAAAP